MNQQTIVPTQHEKHEWSRMAQAAYASGRNQIGHRFSGKAALLNDVAIPISTFDELQSEYRAWLIDGFNSQQEAGAE